MIILAASAARTSNGSVVAPAVQAVSRLRSLVLLLNVTVAATLVGDTCDVYVQSSIDAGATYDDFAHFTQVLGNGGAKKYLAYVNPNLAPTTALKAPQDAALSAGVQQGPLGAQWRVKWVLAGTGSFTFEVDAYPVYDR